MHKDATDGYLVGGKSLLCLSTLVWCLHILYFVDLAYYIKGSSHILLMLLVIKTPIFLWRFNLNTIKPHDLQDDVTHSELPFVNAYLGFLLSA